MSTGSSNVGSGFEVDAEVLRSMAKTADAAGQDVQGLVTKVEAALALGVPGGLDIGSVVGQAEQAWGARLAQLAGEASSISGSLNANAADYQQTDSSILAALDRGRFTL